MLFSISKQQQQEPNHHHPTAPTTDNKETTPASLLLQATAKHSKMTLSALLFAYLAISTLVWCTYCFDPNTFIKAKGTDYCSPNGDVDTCCCNYGTVEEINRQIHPHIKKLLSSLYFRYYKINLHRECPFWKEKPVCTLNSCSVTTCDKNEVPIFLSNCNDISKVKYPAVEHNIGYLKKLSEEFLVLEHNDPEAVFVNLLDNPERFTGYSGENAQKVWGNIYGQNHWNENTNNTSAPGNPLDISPSIAPPPPPAAADQKSHLQSKEKRIYYRIVSGLHASISTHIAMEFLDSSSKQWVKNFELFHDRVGAHPDRIKNMFFVYLILLRGLTKLTHYFEEYPFLDENGNQDLVLMDIVGTITRLSSTCSYRFEQALIEEPDCLEIIRNLKHKFQGATKSIDCIACEKCRLWGKIQLTGLGTALKAIFGLHENERDEEFELSREEVVALFNCLGRLCESLIALDDFRTMYNENPPKYPNEGEGMGREEEEKGNAKAMPNPPLGASVLLKGLAQKMKKFLFQRQ